MKKTVFQISKMDCPSEEQIIRLSLASLKTIHNLEFDISSRKMIAFHEGSEAEILKRLTPLNFNTSIESTLILETNGLPLVRNDNQKNESRVLKILLGRFSPKTVRLAS